MMQLAQKHWPCVVGLILALIAFISAVLFYWASLLSEPVPVRLPIPNAQLKTSGDYGVGWPIPPHLCSKRWHRTQVRLWEMGKPLPLRVEDEDLVMDLGQGRFCVHGQFLWFSSLDDSSPLANGRKYELEISHPSHANAILAGASLALTLGLLLFSLFRAAPLYRILSHPKPTLQTIYRAFAIACLLLAACSCLRFFGPSLCRTLPIPPAAMLQQADGQFRFYLPSWIRRYSFRFETCQLYEDHTLLKRAPLEDLFKGSPGTYNPEKEYVSFRARDISFPPVNNHSYTLKVFFFPPQPHGLLWLLLVSATIGLVLLGQGQVQAIDQPGARHFRWASWGLPVLSVVLLKLWVIAGDDPIGQPADGLWYAKSAISMVWGKTFLDPAPAGFPFLAGLVAQFGFPWRIALELFYLGACYYLALWALSFTRSHLVAFSLFFLMAWHPWLISWFREFMSDPLVSVLLVATVGLMVRLLTQPTTHCNWRPFLLLGLLLFFWEWSRRENPLLFVSYALFMALLLFRVRIQPNWTPRALRRTAALSLLPLLILFGLSTTVKWINYQRYGVFSKCALERPGLLTLMKSLYQIRPAEPVRYAPVTRESLRAACQVSPTLKAYETSLLDTNSAATRLGQVGTKPGEFGSYLICLLEVIPTENLRYQAAREVDAALRDGRLPKRRAWFPLDPNWQGWLPHLPSSFGQWLRWGTWLNIAGEPWGTYENPVLQNSFDQAANRRSANIYPRLFKLSGTLRAPPGSIDTVAVTDDQGQWLGVSQIRSNWYEGGVQEFNICTPIDGDPSAYRLLFIRDTQSRQSISFQLSAAEVTPEEPRPFSRAFAAENTNLVLSATGQTLSYSMTASLSESPIKARRLWWEKLLQAKYRLTLYTLLALAGLDLLVRGPSNPLLLRSSLLCLLLLLGWLSVRAAFYALVVVQTGWLAPRYLFCFCPIYILMLFLALFAACGFLQLIIHKFFSAKHPTPPGDAPSIEKLSLTAQTPVSIT